MAEGAERYNVRNPSVKRILQEVKELQNNPSDDYMSMPLEDNIFEWQFAIRGPKDTEFEGGIYHGRIQLPPEYPLKPPEFVLLTPNGRFETKTKICLSISAHHPEFWQPCWSVRTALVALIAFMPTKPEGAIGSLDYTKEERRALAISSRDAIPKVSTPERQRIIDEIHAEMLKRAYPVPDTTKESTPQDDSAKAEPEVEVSPSIAPSLASTPVEATSDSGNLPPPPDPAPAPAPQAPAPAPAPAAPIPTPAAPSPAPATRAPPARASIQARRSREQSSDFGLTALAIGLTVAIIGILLKRAIRFYGYVM